MTAHPKCGCLTLRLKLSILWIAHLIISNISLFWVTVTTAFSQGTRKWQTAAGYAAQIQNLHLHSHVLHISISTGHKTFFPPQFLNSTLSSTDSDSIKLISQPEAFNRSCFKLDNLATTVKLLPLLCYCFISATITYVLSYDWSTENWAEYTLTQTLTNNIHEGTACCQIPP